MFVLSKSMVGDWLCPSHCNVAMALRSDQLVNDVSM